MSVPQGHASGGSTRAAEAWSCGSIPPRSVAARPRPGPPRPSSPGRSERPTKLGKRRLGRDVFGTVAQQSCLSLGETEPRIVQFDWMEYSSSSLRITGCRADVYGGLSLSTLFGCHHLGRSFLAQRREHPTSHRASKIVLRRAGEPPRRAGPASLYVLQWHKKGARSGFLRQRFRLLDRADGPMPTQAFRTNTALCKMAGMVVPAAPFLFYFAPSAKKREE